MSRVVLSSHGTTGEFVPLVVLGKALRAEGHSVVAAVNRVMQPLFRNAGLDVADGGSAFGPEEARRWGRLFDDWNEVPDRAQLAEQFQDMPGNYRDLAAACRGADLLVTGASQPAAPSVSELLSLPWVCVWCSPAPFPHEPDAPPAVLPEASLHLLAVSSHLSQPRLDHVEGDQVVRQTGFWQYAGEDQPGWTEPDPALQEFLQAGEPPLVLLPGSIPVADPRQVVAVHAEAAALLNRRLVIQEGWAGLVREYLPTTLDDRRVYFARTLPHDWLLERCAAVISHGTIGIVSRALRAGCPMLLEPYDRYQMVHARRIMALGLGRALNPHQLTVSAVARALAERIITAAVIRRSRQMARHLHREDGVATACDLIHELLAQRRQAMSSTSQQRDSSALPGGTARPSLRLAFVISCYGPEIVGGLQRRCRLVAERLARSCTVDILTTCGHDADIWANHYPRGTSMVDGFQVHRFPTTRTRGPACERLATRIFGRAHTLAEEVQWVCELGPYAPELVAYLSASRDRYDFFLFLGCQSYLTVFGLPRVADQALFSPAAHPGEAGLELNVYQKLFHSPRAFLYNSEEERSFTLARFENGYIPNDVVGLGFEAPTDCRPERFRERFGVDRPYVLYLGRVQPAKGCGPLVEHFLRFENRCPGAALLLLAGEQKMPLPSSPAIRFLGRLSEEDKWDALAGAVAVVCPSGHESLSQLTLEGWTVGRPVLCTAATPVVSGLCRRSQGGLVYQDAEEFSGCLETLLTDASLRERLGGNGRQFVTENYTWDIVIEKYERMLDLLLSENQAQQRYRRG